MNHLGSLKDKNKAAEIGQRLSSLGINNTVKQDNNEFHIFIENENNLDKALDVYRVSVGLGPLKFEIPKEWEEIKKIPIGPLTLNLILLCIGIYILSHTQFWDQIKNKLLISSSKDLPMFSEVLMGQGWRLVTPIFLHFNFFHILFNMMWIKDLGKLVEAERGAKFYFFFILITSISSNVTQYLVNGPMFGGMSGVVYAFLGFLWIEKSFNSQSKFKLPKEDIVLMIIWYVVCMTGLFGPIANVAHGIGLCVGMLWSILINYSTTSLELVQKVKFISCAIGLGALSVIVEILKNS